MRNADKKVIALIPNFLTLIFPATSLLLMALLLVKNAELRSSSNYMIPFVAFIILLGIYPALTNPYKLIAEKDVLIFIKPFGRIQRINKSDIKNIEHLWNITGLSYKPFFGKNLHNNKKVIAFIKKHIKNTASRKP